MLAWLAIAGMAAGTYALRLGGFWVLERWSPPPPVERALRHTPGAVLAALISPELLSGGWPATVATALTVAVALRTKGLLAPILVGTLAIWALRLAGG